MKFFLDTANLDELQKGVDLGLVDGVTTNPSLIAKEGKPIEEQIRRICDLVDGDISAEVVSTEWDKMVAEGRKLAKIHKNVVVKVPLTRDGIRACSTLSKEGIRLNVTLCFSAAQAMLAAKAGAYIVSPFVGRVDDIGWDGVHLIREIVHVYSNYGIKTQVLAASLPALREMARFAAQPPIRPTAPLPPPTSGTSPLIPILSVFALVRGCFRGRWV